MKLINTLQNHRYLGLSVLLLANGILFVFTDPVSGLGLGLLTAYLLVGLDVYVVLRSVAWLLNLSGFVLLQRRWLIEAGTVFIFLLLTMQSLGQLSLKDVLVLWLFAIVGYGYFYILQQRYQ